MNQLVTRVHTIDVVVEMVIDEVIDVPQTPPASMAALPVREADVTFIA